MGRSIWLVLLSVLMAVVAACSGQTTEPQSPSPSGGGPDDGRPTPDPTDDPTERPQPADATLGVVVIDLQKVFFETANARNPKSNPNERMKKAAHIFGLASKANVPFFVTYEDAKTGSHALLPSLAAVLPKNAREIIKTTFAATGQPDFVPAIEASGAKRLLVLGAETDVCVLQTMLGLRKRGYEVLALVDALMTEEVNNAPALRRMRQAGIAEITMDTAEALLTTGTLPTSRAVDTPPKIVRPLEMGFVLNDVEGLGASDPNTSPKMVRLRELFMVSEWFKIPIFAADPQKATAALPQDLKTILSRPIVALANRPANVTQLAIAGGKTGLDVANGVDVFIVEDALFGASHADLEPLYVKGAVPTTYKTMYYELTQSVSDAEWPSQQWVKDGDTWWERTKAPEDLPPLLVP